MELELPFELWLLVAAETCDADSIRSLRCVNKRLSEEFKKYEKVLIIKTKTIFDGSKYHGTLEKNRMYTVLRNGKQHGCYAQIYEAGIDSYLVKKNFYWGVLDGMAHCMKICRRNKNEYVSIKFCPYKNGKRHGMFYHKEWRDFGYDLIIHVYHDNRCLYVQNYWELSYSHSDIFIVFGRTIMTIPFYKDEPGNCDYWFGYELPELNDFF